MSTAQPRSPFDPSQVKVPSETVLTVSELTSQIKRAMTSGFPDRLTVRGQLSNCKQHSSGHLYATLKDPRAQLPLVMWASDVARIKFKSEQVDIAGPGRIVTDHRIDSHDPVRRQSDEQAGTERVADVIRCHDIGKRHDG